MSGIDDIRLDIETLRVLMERLEHDGQGDGLMILAVARVLAERQERLAKLERIAAEQ